MKEIIAEVAENIGSLFVMTLVVLLILVVLVSVKAPATIGTPFVMAFVILLFWLVLALMFWKKIVRAKKGWKIIRTDQEGHFIDCGDSFWKEKNDKYIHVENICMDKIQAESEIVFKNGFTVSKVPISITYDYVKMEMKHKETVMYREFCEKAVVIGIYNIGEYIGEIWRENFPEEEFVRLSRKYSNKEITNSMHIVERLTDLMVPPEKEKELSFLENGTFQFGTPQVCIESQK